MDQKEYQELINHLTNGLKPVPKPPKILLGIVVWSMAFLLLGLFSAFIFHIHPKAWELPKDAENIINIVLCTIIGVLSLSYVFKSQIPGCTINLRPLAITIALWLIVNIFNMFTGPLHIGHFGEGIACYLFVVTSGIPMLIASLIFFRKNQSLAPIKTSTLLGITIVFLSFSLLSLCHPEQLVYNDFLMHIFAAFTLVACSIVIGYRFFKYK